MPDLVLLGTDTAVGKTTFACLWLVAFADAFEYWKPVETGPADTAKVRDLVPATAVHPPHLRFAEPVAPPLAARHEQAEVPAAAQISAAKPVPGSPGKRLLIETFGSPFSPLNEQELQIALIEGWCLPSILVASSALGCIGRTLQCLHALEVHNIHPAAVVLLGPIDTFAAEKIRQYRPEMPVFCLEMPTQWIAAAIAQSAAKQIVVLQAIFEATAKDTPSLPSEADLLARDRRVLWHPYTSLRDPDAPLICVGARDEFLHLADGRRVIDGISSWWTILHGHRFPPLMNALRAAANTFDHVHFAGVTHPPGVELAELLLGTMRWQGGRVFYSDNGSTAVEVALKMSYQFWCHGGEPGRTRFVGFEHAYHGDTFGAMAVSRDPVFFGRFEPLLFRADILPLGVARLDAFLAKHSREVAGVILEPLVQAAGGMRLHSAQEVKAIFEVTKKHAVLFIADEVMTGGGRLGRLWAHQAADIRPDLVCAAKTLAGGVLPLAATLVAPEIAEAWDSADRSKTFFHGHSFTAHPLACAVAVANWNILTQKFPETPARMEAFWHETIAPLRRQKNVKDVRILGSLAAVELDLPGGYLAEVGRHLRRSCLADAVLLRPLGSVLYALPPLGTSAESLARIAEAMRRAVASV